MLTQARLKELLDYDPETGEFRWKETRRARKKGKVAGSICSGGYLQVCVDATLYMAQRLAWLYMTGEWPEFLIDHIDGVRSNNRFVNLRQATNAQNLQNLRASYSTNQLGLLGVCKAGNRFMANITVDQKRYHLGSFDNPEEAHEAYLAAKRKLHPFGNI